MFTLSFIHTYVLAILIAQPTAIPSLQVAKIEPSIILPCRVISIHDGDTCTVEFKVRANIRLLDCWAPELSEIKGEEAKIQLQQLVKNKQLILQIPLYTLSDQSVNISPTFTFGRLLGILYSTDHPISINQQMIDSGHAMKNKVMTTKQQ